MRVVLPPLGNFAIGLLKDTALASAVAAPELMFRARTLVDKTFLAHADLRDGSGASTWR